MNQLDVDVLAGIKKTKMHSLFESDNILVNPEDFWGYFLESPWGVIDAYS